MRLRLEKRRGVESEIEEKGSSNRGRGRLMGEVL